MLISWSRIRPFVIFSAVALGAGLLSSLIAGNAGEAYRELLSPPLSPPGWVFPVVWTALYVLMGVGMALVYRAGDSGRALRLWAAQLLVNALWQPLFFGAERRLTAFFVLVALFVLVLAMTREFARTSRLAAALQLPYLFWLLFAGYLNLGFWLLNG